MRITSGIAKGHIIRMPSGPEIRPTLDIARKAIFDILGSEIENSRFLDLFAGTGANGIEALSRGAMSAAFVDSSRLCVKAIKENLEKTRLIERAEIFLDDVFKFIEACSSRRNRPIFDIVFADPPYDKKSTVKKQITKESILPARHASLAKMTLQALSADNILSDNPIVIIEHSLEVEMPDSEGILEKWKGRRYGSTGISIYRKRQ